MIQGFFAWMAIGAGVLAAGLWLKGCYATVLYNERVDADGWIAASITEVDSKGRQTEPLRSAEASNWWNAWAAGVTAGAAAFQALAQLAQQQGMVDSGKS